jgi:cytoskeleton protein RodZ
MSGDMAQFRAAESDTRTGAEVADSTVPGVGQQLRMAREARGLSRFDVANSLKLGPRQVEAIEAEDWQSLSCTTIIRGFVRNYARLLNLDPEPLMGALDDSQMPSAPELKMATGAAVSMPPEGKVDHKDYLRVFLGLIVLLLAIFAYFLLPQDALQSTFAALKSAMQSNLVVPEEAAVETPKAGEVSGEVDLPAQTPVMTEQIPAVEPDPAPAAEQMEQNLPSTPSAGDSLATPSVEAEALPMADVNSGADAVGLRSSGNGLLFKFAEPSWVEVRDRTGRIIFSQLSQAGSQIDIDGQAPFSLVVGNASHVSLSYKGKPVDLSKRSKDDVARLSVE